MLIPLYARIEFGSSITLWSHVRKTIYVNDYDVRKPFHGGIIVNTPQNASIGMDVAIHGIANVENNKLNCVTLINNTGMEHKIHNGDLIAYLFVSS